MNSTNHTFKIIRHQFFNLNLKTISLLFFLSFLPMLLLAQEGHNTKQIFGYTAKPLKAKQGYVHTRYISNFDGLLLIYEGEIGITSFFSVGIGSGLVFSALSKQPGLSLRSLETAGLKAKIAFPIGKYIHLGVGTYVFRKFGDKFSDPENTNVTTGLITFDLDWIQASFGAGFSSKVIQYTLDDKLGPVITFGTIIPLSKKIYLVSESWGIFYGNISFGAGFYSISGLTLRWNPNRFSFELGALGYYGNDGDGDFRRLLPQAGISFHF